MSHFYKCQSEREDYGQSKILFRRSMRITMLKKIGSLLFALSVLSLVIFHPIQEISAETLSDIPDRSKENINLLIEKEIIFGYTDGTFKPKNPVSRQEATAMIGRALNLDNTKQKTTFPDVTSDMYASGYIASATEKGIITGHSDGSFRPNETVTRAQMAIIISRAFDIKGETKKSFPDVANDSLYYEAINSIASAGISVGYPDGTFKPYNKLTREEFSILVAKAISENGDYVVQEPSEEKPEPQEPEEPKDETLDVLDERIVTADSLNVRQGPSIDYDIVGKLTTGNAVKVHKLEGDWAYVSYGELKGYVHTYYLVAKPGEATPQTVAIDPGHGGKDPGASANGLVEKEVVLDVSLMVRDYLKDSGINVVMTRQSDWYPSLDGRVAIAQKGKADAFVSVHANAFMSSATGVETFYYAAGMTDRERKSYHLAKFINDRLYKAMDMNNRGVKNAGYRVIKATTLPSVLTEIGFLTNDNDARKLKTQHYREEAAQAIALGIIDYYNWRD